MILHYGKSSLPGNVFNVSWPHFYITGLCSVAFKRRLLLRHPIHTGTPLPHLQHCRTECCQKQTDEQTKELKPFIQLPEHIACHLCATLLHGQCLAPPDSRPAPANRRTWPPSSGDYAVRGFRSVWARASTRCLGRTCFYPLSLLKQDNFHFNWWCSWLLDEHCSTRSRALETVSKSHSWKWQRAT